eukprot:jgi/Mesvir1/19751/Mv13057-RA.1
MATSGGSCEEHDERLRRFVEDWVTHVAERQEACSLNEVHGHDLSAGDPTSHPVAVCGKPTELLPLRSLFRSNNPAFAKLGMCMCYLAGEMGRLGAEAEESIFPSLLILAQALSVDSLLSEEGAPQEALSGSLRRLLAARAWVLRVREVAVCLGRQLAELCSDTQRHYATFPGQAHGRVSVHVAFRALGDGLALLASFDEVIAQCSALRQCFSLFRSMLHTVREAPGVHGGWETSQLDQLEGTVRQLEYDLLGDNVFQQCIQSQLLTCLRTQTQRKRGFLNSLAFSTHQALQGLSTRIGVVSERVGDRFLFLSIICREALLVWLAGEAATPDKRTVRTLWDLCAKAPVIPIQAHVCLYPMDFMATQMPSWALQAALPRDYARLGAQMKTDFLANLDATFARDVKALSLVLKAWIVRFDSAMPTQVPAETALGARLRFATQGLLAAHRLRMLILAFVQLHASLRVAVHKDGLQPLRHAVELLKAVEATFGRRSSLQAEAAPHLLALLQERLRASLLPLEEALEATLLGRHGAKPAALHPQLWSLFKAMDGDLNLDTLAAVQLALSSLSSCGSGDRMLALEFAVDYLSVLKHALDMTEAAELMWLMDMVTRFHKSVAAACDCSFLYWSREFLPAMLRDLYARVHEARCLSYTIAAFRDVEPIMRRANSSRDQALINADASAVQEEGGASQGNHGGGDGGTCLRTLAGRLLAMHSEEIEAALNEEIITRVCQDVETDLRLHVHATHVGPESINLNPAKTGVRDVSLFLRMSPIHLAGKVVDIRARVARHLARVFYNFTAVALHNGQTYTQMRILAVEKYGLELAPDTHLPERTLEQGQDVLALLKQLHVFVASYSYDLNTQVFVERPGGEEARARKFLHSIRPTHVANSIRAHGLGVVNTAVNVTYRFLQRKVQTLSQMLYEDRVKSRLLLEEGFLLQETLRAGKSRVYPMMRAEELYRDLRRQGSKPGAPPSQGPSYLDQLRRVVTEMGNALGFVRLLRLGAVNYRSDAAKYIWGAQLDPPLPHGSFAAGARDAGFSPECLQAARNLDAVVRGLLSPEQFSRSTSGGNNPGAATPGGAVPGGSSATGVQPSAPAASITGAGSVASSCSPGASSSSGSGAVTSGVGSGRPSGASPGHGMTSSGLTTTSASRLPGSSSSSSIASTDSSTEGAPSGIPRSGGDAPGQPSRDGAGAGAGTGTALAAAPEAASSSETYFQSLAGVFAEELRKESHLHMRLFLPLVPALTLSFVEAMLVARDRLSKRGRSTARHLAAPTPRQGPRTRPPGATHSSPTTDSHSALCTCSRSSPWKTHSIPCTGSPPPPTTLPPSARRCPHPKRSCAEARAPEGGGWGWGGGQTQWRWRHPPCRRWRTATARR